MNKRQQEGTVPAVRLEKLTKRFGFMSALKGLELVLEQGEFLTIFGPNGAGKTTLLRILSTLVSPTSGTAALLGYRMGHDGERIRQAIGVLSHQPFLIPALTVYENLKFYGQMFGVAPLESRVESLLTDVGMYEFRDSPVETCSRGMQQRLGIARALLHHPRLLLLDEPYTGLDQKGIRFLNHILETFVAEGKTVIMTCHNFDRGLKLCTKAAILKRGELKYYGAPSTLEESFAALYQRLTG